MRKLLIMAVATALLVVVALWFSFPSIAKNYLEDELGKRQFSHVMKEADAANLAALGKIGSVEILLDIPSEPIIVALSDELQKAANLIDLGSGWKASLLAEPTISFHASAIRAEAPMALSNEDIGAATVTIQLDVVPSIQENELVAVPYVTALSLGDVEVYGFQLPGAVADKLNAAIGKSLEALNNKIPKQRIAINLPDELLKKSEAKPAVLISNQAVAVILGSEAATKRAINGAYADEFIEAAREVLPNYVPGTGLIAVRPSESPPMEASETMRDEAAAANLAALEATLGIDGSIGPEELDPSVFGNLIMVTAEGRYFEQQLKEFAVKSIADLDTGDVALDVKPENVKVVLMDGVLGASAAGTVKIAEGKLEVGFSLTAWGVLRPGRDGLVASYSLREIKVSSVKVAWANRGVTLAVPYEAALGDVVARFIEELPDSLLKIPSVPLTVASGDEGDFKLVTKQPSLSLTFAGRAVSISPERVAVFAAPSLEGADVPIPQAAVSPGKLPRLTALAAMAHQALLGEGDIDSLSLATAKAGLAHLLEGAWASLDPTISIDHQSTETFDADEIKAIPGDASCGNPCGDVDQCGDILKCTENICTTAVVDVTCHTWCPGGSWNPICKEICEDISREVCREEPNAGCISQIENCLKETAQCTAAWASGYQASCEIALAAIKATDTTGLAKVSGGAKLVASATTATGSRLVVAPDLSGLDLAIDVGGVAGVDAWLDITWTDFGNLFLCPSGRLAVHLDANARLATSPLRSTIKWEPSGDALKATFSFGTVAVLADTTEGPLGKLITSNPGLLTCGLGQAITGLAVIAVPNFTQDLLAEAIRSASGEDDKAKIVAGIIDGHFSYEGEIPPVTFDLPRSEVTLLDKLVTLKPRMSDVALIMGTGTLSQ
jgi:hypothetical protein